MRNWLRQQMPLTTRERTIVTIVATIILLLDILNFPRVAHDSVIAGAAAAVPPVAVSSIAADPSVTAAPNLDYESSQVDVANPFVVRFNEGVQSGDPSGIAGLNLRGSGSVVPSLIPGAGGRMADITKVKLPPDLRPKSEAVTDLGHGSSSALLQIGTSDTEIVHVGSDVGGHHVKSIDVVHGVTLDDGSRIPAALGNATIGDDTDTGNASNGGALPSPSPAPTATPNANASLGTENSPPAPRPSGAPFQPYQRRAPVLFIPPNATGSSTP